MLFLAPAITPLVSAGENTAGRANPDFSVSEFTLDGAGSVMNGNDIEVENATHVARIVVSNSGSADGVASVSLVHRGYPTAGETILTTVSLGNIPSTSSATPVLIAWTASPGDLQALFARVTAQGTDSNSANDEMRINFNVSSPPFMEGDVLDDSIPIPTGGSSLARVSNSPQLFNATVINNGIKDISAVFELEFVSTSNPANIKQFWSGELVLGPGSLFVPAVSENLSTSFDGGLMTGLWSLTATVIYNGTGGWTYSNIVQQRDIEFSDFIADLSTPADRTTEPGLTTTLTFIVTNNGANADSFSIAVSSVLGWNQPHSPSPSTGVFSP